MKKIGLIFTALLLVSATVGVYLYNKPHQDIQHAKADFHLPASALFEEFEADEAAANIKYLDKVVEVSGKIISVSETDQGLPSLTLDGGGEMFGVICQMDQHSKHQELDFEEGDEVSLRGICTGKLMDVVLVRCVKI